MKDFIAYFIGGMFGAELMRRIATRPYGFYLLWATAFVSLNLVVMLVLAVFIAFSVIANPPTDQTIFQYLTADAYDVLVLLVTAIAPWVLLFSLVMSFGFAGVYFLNYRNNLREREKNEAIASNFRD